MININNIIKAGIVLILFLFVGCSNQPTTPKNITTQEKVNLAFKNAEDLQDSYSSWDNAQEKLPLTIIAIAYMDPDITDTKEYQEYLTMIKKIQKDIKYLDEIAGTNLSNKYSSIKFIDFEESEDAQNRFNIAYQYRHKDKITLTDALRPDREKSSAELLIRLNLEELQKGNLTIEGYKTVKEEDKKRNSYYYTLRKDNYAQLNKSEQKEVITNSFLAILEMSIPNYVSINSTNLLNNDDGVRILTSSAEKTYNGEHWIYLKENDMSVHSKEPIIIYTQSLSKKDINILNKKKYTNISLDDDIEIESINQLSNTINMKYVDPFLAVPLKELYKDKMSSSSKDKDGVFIVEKENMIDPDEIYLSSNFNKDDHGYTLMQEFSNIPKNDFGFSAFRYYTSFKVPQSIDLINPKIYFDDNKVIYIGYDNSELNKNDTLEITDYNSGNIKLDKKKYGSHYCNYGLSLSKMLFTDIGNPVVRPGTSYKGENTPKNSRVCGSNFYSASVWNILLTPIGGIAMSVVSLGPVVPIGLDYDQGKFSQFIKDSQYQDLKTFLANQKYKLYIDTYPSDSTVSVTNWGDFKNGGTIPRGIYDVTISNPKYASKTRKGVKIYKNTTFKLTAGDPRLNIKTNPIDAKITFLDKDNKVFINNTPLKQKKYKFKISHPDFITMVKDIDMVEPLSLDLNLVRAYGYITINNLPENSTIKDINNNIVAQSNRLRVKLGINKLKISHPDFKTKILDINLEKANEQLDVTLERTFGTAIFNNLPQGTKIENLTTNSISKINTIRIKLGENKIKFTNPEFKKKIVKVTFLNKINTLSVKMKRDTGTITFTGIPRGTIFKDLKTKKVSRTNKLKVKYGKQNIEVSNELYKTKVVTVNLSKIEMTKKVKLTKIIQAIGSLRVEDHNNMKYMTYKNAKKHCSNLKLNGRGWKLPTISQLHKIKGNANYHKSKSTWSNKENNVLFFGDDKATAYNLSSGKIKEYKQKNKNYVRCIR
ncbi:MAG: hypothetical protein DRG78_07345 [Epsilonproteobacteria bacterium]|nr:MAG: hypothetical protein DRG78_07345 [Campylobacterota bacterium]